MLGKLHLICIKLDVICMKCREITSNLHEPKVFMQKIDVI